MCGPGRGASVGPRGSPSSHGRSQGPPAAGRSAWLTALSVWFCVAGNTGTYGGADADGGPTQGGAISLVGGRRSFAGSLIDGIRETQERSDLSAEHVLGSEIEVIPAEKINGAYERVMACDKCCRFVVDTSTLG